MIDEITKALQDYQQKWQAEVANRQDKAFFEALKPTACAWKVADPDDYIAKMLELRNLCDQVFDVWMNERWIAKMHLRDQTLPMGLSVIKLMLRRPGSTDALGLDHVDFYTAAPIEPTLKKEPNMTWQFENNGAPWYSVRFAAGEAKLRNNTIFGVCGREMLETEKKVLA